MKTLRQVLNLWIVALVAVSGQDLECKLVDVRDDAITIELKNIGQTNLAIMYGDYGIKIRGAAVRLHKSEISFPFAGEYGSMRELPALVLLLPGHTMRSRVGIKNTKMTEILHLVVAVNYLEYDELLKGIKNDKGLGFSWKEEKTRLIYKKDKIEPLGVKYGFPLGLGEND